MVGLGEAARAQRPCSSVFQRTAARSGLGFRIVLTYILGMPKRSPRIKLFEGRVIQLRATPTRLTGYFEGASADDAIKRAIVEREISDPHTQSRLAAQKVREIG